jgi:hypothetical protein
MSLSASIHLIYVAITIHLNLYAVSPTRFHPLERKGKEERVTVHLYELDNWKRVQKVTFIRIK